MQPPKIGFSKKKSTILPTKHSAFLVENSGIEPLTSCMPCKRSPEPRGYTPHTKLWEWMMIHVKTMDFRRGEDNNDETFELQI